jgi:TatD DNase family protein
VLVDTHCHLNHHRMNDVAECIRRACDAEVTRMVVVGYDPASSRHAVDLAAQYAGTIYAAVGVHPHDASSWTRETQEEIASLARAPGVVAIGEIGLDFHYDFSPRPAQFAAFHDQLGLAASLDLPVVIHCREAHQETLDVLEQSEVGRTGGVMHCWAGNVEEAERTVALGMMLGFGGTITFKNAENVRDGLRAVPIDRILLETDAPYLAPIPHRGKRNEPAFTRIIAESAAALRSIDLEELASVTTANAVRMFRFA